MNKKTSLTVLSQYRFPIMGFGAFLILFFHLWLNIFNNISFLAPIERFLKNTAYYGVDIFFLMSAIGLYHSMSKNDNIKQFYYKRFSRLFVPWLVCCLLTAWDNKWSFLTLLKNFTGYSFFFQSIYTFKWYIIAVCIVYLLFPFYFHLFNKADNKKMFTLKVILLWFITFIFLQKFIRSDFYGLIWRMPIFLVGVLCEYLILNEKVEIKNIYLWFILVLGVALAYFLNGKKVPINDLQLLTSNFCLAFGSSLLLGSFLQRKNLRTPVLNIWGKSSLELYLFQELIGMKVIKLLLPLKFRLLINLIVFFVVSAICYFFSRLFTYIKNKFV
ncbi:MAG: acyltransferase [Erysipelotrichia bacterium]|nr:acyltransferase [Erysipelotrichia bacterium]